MLLSVSRFESSGFFVEAVVDVLVTTFDCFSDALGDALCVVGVGVIVIVVVGVDVEFCVFGAFSFCSASSLASTF